MTSGLREDPPAAATPCTVRVIDDPHISARTPAGPGSPLLAAPTSRIAMYQDIARREREVENNASARTSFRMCDLLIRGWPLSRNGVNYSQNPPLPVVTWQCAEGG